LREAASTPLQTIGRQNRKTAVSTPILDEISNPPDYFQHRAGLIECGLEIERMNG